MDPDLNDTLTYSITYPHEDPYILDPNNSIFADGEPIIGEEQTDQNNTTPGSLSYDQNYTESTSVPFIDESNYTLTNDNLLGDGNHTDEFANPELPDPIQLDRNQTEFPDDHILEPLFYLDPNGY